LLFYSGNNSRTLIKISHLIKYHT